MKEDINNGDNGHDIVVYARRHLPPRCSNSSEDIAECDSIDIFGQLFRFCRF